MRHVLREGAVANFSDERNAGESAHVEALASDAAEPIVQAVGVVVDFIRTDARGKQGICRSTALFEQGEVDALVQLHCELGSGEVASDLLHRLLFYARMERYLQLLSRGHRQAL